MKTQFFFFILLCFFSTRIFSKDYIIKSKGFIDAQQGEVVSLKYIHIKGKKIFRISEILSPGDNQVIDLSDYYILPGLIDSHSHVFITQTTKDKTFENALSREARLNDQLRISRAKIFLREYLQEGFTSIFDLGNSGSFLDVILRDEIKNNSLYPMLFISGPGIAKEKGQFDKSTPSNLVSKEYCIINSHTDFNLILKEYTDRKVDILKIYLDNSPGTGVMDEATLRSILKNKHIKKFKKITFHSITSEGAALILKLNLKNVEHYTHYIGGSNAVEFATPTDLTEKTLLEFNYYSKVSFLAQKIRTNLLKKSKIKILFGPDFYFHSNAPNFNRAKYIKSSIDAFVEAGLSPLDIIRSMTLNPAQSLKLEDKIGQIKVGNFANLIAVKENPLIKIETIKDIRFVMNLGKPILPVSP